ncbi:MAG: hypothetical protein DMF50_05715 [Acidobacteria bacterium]|nr:MAG: hypothetical protein DMF50_05715 [Acidobacteriota bacterium]
MVEPFRSRLAALLGATPRIRTIEVLHRMRQAGYPGGKSALYEMVRALRPRDTSVLSRFKGLPGVLSQHALGSVMVRYAAGGRERIHFFVSCLGHSRFMHASLVGRARLEPLLRSLLAGFEAFGGVPLVAVFDRPRLLIVGRDGQRIDWNDTLGQVALDYRFVPELRAPGVGQDEGSIGDLVEFVRRGFFKGRRFQGGDDVPAQLADWLREVNSERPCGAMGVAPASRLAADRGCLRPLAIPPGEYALRFAIVVDEPGFVEFQGRRYAMPPEMVGIPGLLWLYPESLTIVAGRRRFEYARVPERPAPRRARIGAPRGRLRPETREALDLVTLAEPGVPDAVNRHRLFWKTEVE